MFPDKALRWPRGCWPDESQTLLLKACLLEDDTACLQAWERWRRLTPLDFVDGSSLKLLVLLYGRLRRVSRTLPDMQRLAGIARYYWVRTQLTGRATVELLRAASGAGIETMLLKGAALNATVYAGRDRPMADIDLVVRRCDIDASLELVERLGWQPRFLHHQEMRDVSHATHLVNRNGQDLDLHWDIFHDRFLSEEEMEDIWQASRPIEVGGLPTRVLCPADQLVHICAHGARYDNTPSFRWLADAYLIIKAYGASLDWARCAHLARRHGLVPAVKQTLIYLKETLDLGLPEGAVLVERERASLGSRFAQRLVARRQRGAHPVVRGLPRDVLAYLRLRRARGGIGLGRFLCLVNDLDMPPAAALRHFARLSGAETVSRWKAALTVARERVKGRQLRVVGISAAGPDVLEGAYPPDWHGGQVFCWTLPSATIHVRLDPADYLAELNLMPNRAWGRETLKIAFNRSPVTCVQAETNAIRFRVSRDMFVDYRQQRLVLQCEPWECAVGDSRHLGFPLIDARFLKLL